jgi:hypothetical protein
MGASGEYFDRSEDHSEQSEEKSYRGEVVVTIGSNADSNHNWNQREVGFAGVGSVVAEPVDKDSEHWTGGPHDLMEGNGDHGPESS